MREFYVPSGKFGWSAITLFPIIAIFAAVVIGHLYSVLIYLSGYFIYKGICLALLMFAMWYISGEIMVVKFKVRNTKLAVFFGLCFGALTYLCSFCFWFASLVNVSPDAVAAALVFDPSVIGEAILEINNAGTFTLSQGQLVSGIFLWIIWVMELLMFVGVPALFAYDHSIDPFSEKYKAWFSLRSVSGGAYIQDVELFKKLLLNSDNRILDLIKKAGPDDMAAALYEINYLKGGDEFYLNVYNVVQNITSTKSTSSQVEVISKVKIDQKLVSGILFNIAGEKEL